MGKGKFSWKISAKNIGCFPEGLNATLSLSAGRVAIYAPNGSGKTSLSRMFRAAELKESSSASCYLTQGKNEGSFTFSIKLKDGQERKLSLSVYANKPDAINDSTDLIFHVFNTDYVDENLRAVSFSPSGEIDGFIVGKGNIDITHEKNRLQELGSIGKKLRKSIEDEINTSKGELRKLGVSASMKEYVSFNYDNLLAAELDEDEFERIAGLLKSLRDIPEGAHIKELPKFIQTVDGNKIKECLTTEYSKANLSESFLESIRTKVGFVETGMKIQDGTKCPFCGQEYNDYSRKLIQDYDSYLKDREKQTIDSIQSFIDAIAEISTERQRYVVAYLEAANDFDRYKMGFKDFAGTNFGQLSPSSQFDELAKALQNTLEEKKRNISIRVECECLDAFLDALSKDEESFGHASQKIESLNKAIRDTRAEATKLRKELCRNALLKCRRLQDETIRKVLSTRNEYSQLQSEIAQKESRTKRPKREAVANLFKQLLQLFFGDKYSFDIATFSLTLDGVNLSHKTATVLSDGEKSVVAFCYYVASTYELLESDESAERLLFVIDDPISSLDFHYVYQIGQIIRNINERFDAKTNRFLIFTHNASFFNLLTSSGIIKDAFLINSGKIKPCGKQLLAPYEMHLRDVYAVAHGAPPSHTTGNSIRQILESLKQFEAPDQKDLYAYLSLEHLETLRQVEYIYTLVNMSSHGSSPIENEIACDEGGIQRACIAVVEYISNRYPGQLSLIESEPDETQVNNG